MNSGNSKTSGRHILLVNPSDKINMEMEMEMEKYKKVIQK